jgi:hypothetical protein
VCTASRFLDRPLCGRQGYIDECTRIRYSTSHLKVYVGAASPRYAGPCVWKRPRLPIIAKEVSFELINSGVKRRCLLYMRCLCDFFASTAMPPKGANGNVCSLSTRAQIVFLKQYTNMTNAEISTITGADPATIKRFNKEAVVRGFDKDGPLLDEHLVNKERVEVSGKSKDLWLSRSLLTMWKPAKQQGVIIFSKSFRSQTVA